MAASEAVASDSTASPSSTTTTAKPRDTGVLGTMSPYPTVAAVMKASHRPSDRVFTRGSSIQKPTPPISKISPHSTSEYSTPRRAMCSFLSNFFMPPARFCARRHSPGRCR